MSPFEVNIPLLRKTVEWVEWQATQPSGVREWNQDEWATETSCGTTFCIAGKITHDAYPGLSVAEIRNKAYHFAKESLGLCTYDALDLFSSDHNTPEKVRAVAERIAEERL